MNEARDNRRVEAMTKESHTVIAGKYEVLEELGDGAAGTAYKVRHALLDTLLSVTVLPAALTDDPRQVALVQDAVRQAFGLRHDHIVPVLDFGEEGERYYLVEAFVDAEPLDRVLRDGKPLAPSHPRPCVFTARLHRARCSRALRPRRQRRASRTRRPSGSPAPATIRAATSSRSGSSSSRCSRGGASSRAATRRPETCSSTAMGRSCRSSPVSRPRGCRAWWGERSAGRLPIGSRAWPSYGARSTHACAASGREAAR